MIIIYSKNFTYGLQWLQLVEPNIFALAINQMHSTNDNW
jgi:hypothetical protein